MMKARTDLGVSTCSLLMVLCLRVAHADGLAIADDQLLLEQVTPNVYAIIGPLGNRSPANHGNNATFGFVVTDEGVLLVDPGGTHKGAARLHGIIRQVTDRPVKYVINTGGQDHRWLGNDYFRRRGARIIASKAAVRDQTARLNDIFLGLVATAGDAAVDGTVESYADIRFDAEYELMLGGIEFRIVHPGAAHSPGDAYVWLPEQRVVFAGDIVYVDRMLSVMDFSSSASWVEAFESIAALKPEIVIPGHGRPTTLAQAEESTYRYLTTLRAKVREFMEAGGEIYDVGTIDQSRFDYLKNFEQLKGRNVQQVFQEMEWE